MITFCVPGLWLKSVPGLRRKTFYNLNRIKARLGIYENKELSPDEVSAIARELVVDEAEVKEMNGRLGGDKSLNVSVSDEDEDEKLILSSTRAKILKKTSLVGRKPALRLRFCSSV